MIRKSMFLLMALVLSLVTVAPVFAAAPGQGLVVEGERIPGAALGFTRAQVEAAFGDPASCQSVSSPGDFGFCSYLVEGGGKVWARYRGADGGNPSNSSADVVYNFSWEEQVSGWVTTAGVNTSLARTNPEAVIAAYPNAQVIYNMFGAIIQVRDYEQGIQVNWDHNFYSGTFSVRMAISEPSTPPPPREKLVRVVNIDLSARKTKGQRIVTAFVQVQDDRTLAASGATVSATWVHPDGSTENVEAITSGAGYAYFEIQPAKRGVYTLMIRGVLLDEHRFDDANSVLQASVQVK